MKVTFILPNFNQLYYLRNLIHWIQWMHPDRGQYQIVVIDNGSTYRPLLEFYHGSELGFGIHSYDKNEFVSNLRDYIDNYLETDYYVIADPDVFPIAATPHNYLDYFIKAIEQGYHHAGFDLVTDDLPDWLYKKDHIIHDEQMCRVEKISIDGIDGYRGAIDTTFCLYKKSNGGWYAPMNGKDWTNAVRLFKANHMKWYQNKDHINEELDYYFKTANYRDFTGISAGKNYYRPPQYIKE